MSFGTELALGLAELRVYAESRMRASCVIERPTADMHTDDDGVVTPMYAPVYEGKCYTRYPGMAQEANRELAGATVTESRIVVRVPFGTVYRPGDRVRITAEPDTPQMVGDVYVVESIDTQSQATAQRLLCTDSQTGAL